MRTGASQSCRLLPTARACIIEQDLQRTSQFPSVPTPASVQVSPPLLFGIRSELPLGVLAPAPTPGDDSISLVVTPRSLRPLNFPADQPACMSERRSK